MVQPEYSFENQAPSSRHGQSKGVNRWSIGLQE